MLWFDINADCSLRKNLFYCGIYYNFQHTFVPYSVFAGEQQVRKCV